MNWEPDWELRGRIVLTLMLLTIVGTAFFGVMAWIFTQIAASAADEGSLPEWAVEETGIGLTLLLVLGIVLFEGFRGDSRILQTTDAVAITDADYPDLCRTVRQLAQQADLPVPTVAVADQNAPYAFTTGYTQRGATLVVSTGLLDNLSEDELSAVVAHELAHVKNHDVALMMAGSLPVVIAQRIMDWANRKLGRGTATSHSGGKLIGAVAFAIAGFFWVIGRSVLQLLSRYREYAADRGAITITGTPAALASALACLDESVSNLPQDDIRTAEHIAAFSIISPKPAERTEDDSIRLGPEGEREPVLYNATRPIRELASRVYRTHPDTEDRIARLREMQANM